MAAALIEVLSDDVARASATWRPATQAVRRYDWSVVAGQIMRVYETVAGAGVKVQVAGTPARSELPTCGEGEAARGVS